MEPAQSDATPRPKGFVRRNWGAGLVLILSAVLSCTTVYVHERDWMFSCADGEISILYAPKWIVSNGIELSVPRVGLSKMPRYEFNQFFEEHFMQGIVLPIWFCLGLSVSWIAFREWRRKRAAAQQ
jgi:hypothetical protein